MFLQVLYARDVDQRTSIFEKALEVGKETERKTKVNLHLFDISLFFIMNFKFLLIIVYDIMDIFYISYLCIYFLSLQLD